GTVPLSFTVTTSPADRVTADLLAVPVGQAKSAHPTRRGSAPPARVLGPGAEAIDDALGGGLVAFLDEVGFEGRLGDAIAVPTNGSLRAKAAIVVGVGDPDELTADGLRRAAAAVARRASKVASVATTLSSAAANVSAAD